MNMDTFQIPAFITVVLALISLIILPTTSLALSRTPAKAAVKGSDSSDGVACDLPPSVEIDESDNSLQDTGPPSMDTRVLEKYSTATFAMG